MDHAPPTDWRHVRATFRRIWGYEDFRPPQGEVIQCLLSGRDALIVMPTGSGKSLCFQLPALLQTGLTLVISPLVALMEDQVSALRGKQLPASLLHSQIAKSERQRTLQRIRVGDLRLLYLSPETLLSQSVWAQLCHPQVAINGLVIDEAHCLVQWGETFRPTYRRLGTVRSALLAQKPSGTRIAIAAFTATADPQTQQTINTVLQLQNPKTVLLSPYRSNLDLVVRAAWTPRCRRQLVLRYVQQRPGQAGLIYTRTRRDSEDLAAWLQQQGLATAAYHGGLSPQRRRQIEQDWLQERCQFVVCTAAFGMGIDKPNVRWVIHFHPPLLLSEYIQEIGRGGRDRHSAEALTLVSEPTGWLDPTDRQRRQFFQHQGRSQYQLALALARKLPPQGKVDVITRQYPDSDIALALLHSTGQLQWHDPFHYSIQLRRTATQSTISPVNATRGMTDYLYTRNCRWQVLLQLFGFPEEAAGFRCGHCDNCRR